MENIDVMYRCWIDWSVDNRLVKPFLSIFMYKAHSGSVESTVGSNCDQGWTVTYRYSSNCIHEWIDCVHHTYLLFKCSPLLIFSLFFFLYAFDPP